MRIAITGGVAEGKSTILGYLKEAGYKTASADDAAREVFNGQEVQSFLAARLKDPADRNEVREALAEDPVFRRDFNRVTHPAIMRKLLDSDATFVEVPLLIETCTQSLFSRVWVACCGREEQLRRLTLRVGETSARKLLGAQLNTACKIPFADLIVRTNRPETGVHSYVLESVATQLGNML